MKTKAKTLICLMIIFSIFGCKKQDLGKENVTQINPSSEKVRDWLEMQPGILNSQKFLLDGKMVTIPEKIQWEETNYFDGAKTSITPVNIESVNGKLPTYKYLLTEKDNAGKVSKGNYFVALSNKKVQEPSGITPELLNSKSTPKDFNGALIKYDLNNDVLFSRHYENGVLSGKTDKIAVKKSKNQIPVENNAPLDEGCGYVTIDWYWQTWENGVLVNEEYLFSSTIIVCEGGGGGGNPATPSDLEMCTNAVANILNSTLPSSELISNEIESEAATTRTRLYAWKCVKNVGWWVVAYDRGVQTRTGIHQPWTWLSLENLSISKQGTTASYGGQVTATKVVAQPVMGTTFSIMYVVVNIKTTVTKNNVSVTDERDIPSHYTYHVDAAPVPGF